MSGMALSVLCEMSLFISTFVHVVPPMFDPANILRTLFWGFGVAYAEENVTGRAHSVLCEMSLFISTFVHVVPPMFDPAHYWGPYLRL